MIFLPPGKSFVFLRNFEKALLEILMCSSTFCSPGKFIYVLIPFLFLLEDLMCSYKRIMSSPGKLEVLLLHPSLLENLMCSRNLFKKVAPGKQEQIFQQNSSSAASVSIYLFFFIEIHSNRERFCFPKHEKSTVAEKCKIVCDFVRRIFDFFRRCHFLFLSIHVF